MHDIVELGMGHLSEPSVPHREGPPIPISGIGDCQCLHMGLLVEQTATPLQDAMSREWFVWREGGLSQICLET